MITIKNIQKSFGENKVLKGIDLTVKKGEVVTILGPSGSGKTTFLRCLNLLERPENGEISMHDQIINCKKPSKKEVLQLRKNTAMVFQQYNLFSHKTVIQNVMEGLTVARKIPKKNCTRNCGTGAHKSRFGGQTQCLPFPTFWRTKTACWNCASTRN